MPFLLGWPACEMVAEILAVCFFSMIVPAPTAVAYCAASTFKEKFLEELSHVSPVPTTLSPHQEPNSGEDPKFWQVSEHPLPPAISFGSHCSPLSFSTMPLPHFETETSWSKHEPEQFEFAAPFWLPLSHSSPGSSLPLPHTGCTFTEITCPLWVYCASPLAQTSAGTFMPFCVSVSTQAT